MSRCPKVIDFSQNEPRTEKVKWNWEVFVLFQMIVSCKKNFFQWKKRKKTETKWTKMPTDLMGENELQKDWKSIAEIISVWYERALKTSNRCCRRSWKMNVQQITQQQKLHITHIIMNIVAPAICKQANWCTQFHQRKCNFCEKVNRKSSRISSSIIDSYENSRLK